MANPLLVHFVGGTAGRFAVSQARAIAGEGLPTVSHVDVREAPSLLDAPACAWLLRGVTSHQRYVERVENVGLRAVQAGLGRPEATHAALIPIRKSPAWWELAQDDRRAIFEGRSQHIAATLKYLPAVARRLHHARDLGEPFDFITWFEFAPEHAGMFDELLSVLRSTEEWNYVEREVELRLIRSI